MKYAESAFTKFQLTEEEHIQGLILNVYQKAVIQNQINEVASQLIGMKIDVTNPMEYAVNQAALQGQMETLQNQIERSNETERIVALANSAR